MGAHNNKNEQDWLERIDNLALYKKEGRRAPNKPLLLLFIMSNIQNNQTSQIVYTDAFHKKMKRLLTTYGRKGKTESGKPNYAFRRLINDKIWDIETVEGLGSEIFEPRNYWLKELKALKAVGQLNQKHERALLANPALIQTTIRRLLSENWDDTLHDDICEAIGLIVDEPSSKERDEEHVLDLVSKRKRDSEFRKRVIRAYRGECAMCGWDGRFVGGGTAALEAAHIRWHSHDGPDETNNGLSLCTLHHKLLDLGVVGLNTDKRVLVSQDFLGNGEAAQTVRSLSGLRLPDTQDPGDLPSGEYIEWHSSEVFREPAVPLNA